MGRSYLSDWRERVRGCGGRREDLSDSSESPHSKTLVRLEVNPVLPAPFDLSLRNSFPLQSSPDPLTRDRLPLDHCVVLVVRRSAEGPLPLLPLVLARRPTQFLLFVIHLSRSVIGSQHL